jgi:translation initiation factor IF-2
VIDWAGRVQQTVTLGIKPATIKTMSEGEMKKEIALVKAAAKQGVTRAAIVKAAGGAKAPLKAVEKAIKAATIKADPSAEKERIALAELVGAIRSHMASLDHAGRMTYMASLVTTAKANPAEVAA